VVILDGDHVDAISAKGIPRGVIAPDWGFRRKRCFARRAAAALEIKTGKSDRNEHGHAHASGLYYARGHGGRDARAHEERTWEDANGFRPRQAKLVSKAKYSTTDEFLTLKGLRLIWEKNQPAKRQSASSGPATKAQN